MDWIVLQRHKVQCDFLSQRFTRRNAAERFTKGVERGRGSALERYVQKIAKMHRRKYRKIMKINLFELFFDIAGRNRAKNTLLISQWVQHPFFP